MYLRLKSFQKLSQILKITFIFSILGVSVFAQDSTRGFIRDKQFLVLPVVFRLPETRWGAGIAGNGTFSFKKDSLWAKASQITFGLTFTQNKQVLVFVPFRIFAKNNKYYFNSDLGWYRYNYFYTGIGENRVQRELYDVEYPRIRFLASQKISNKMYLGFRVNYEAYKVTGTEPEGQLASGTINGSDFSRTSGVGVSLLRDTRDAVFYPRKGIFGEFYIVPSSRIFGANRNFTKISMDLAHYVSLSKKTVWANNYVGIANIGNVPFSQMAYLGGSYRMRGLYEGYFRDKNGLIIQSEMRQEVWKRLGLVGFGAVGFMGNDDRFIKLNLPKLTYGLGLRIATKDHLNLRIDYAMSPYEKANMYFTIGEAF